MAIHFNIYSNGQMSVSSSTSSHLVLMFTDANKLECWPLSTGTLLLASFQNSTHQTKKLNFSSLLRRSLMNVPCLRLAFPEMVLLSILKAFLASNGDSIKTGKRYQGYY